MTVAGRTKLNKAMLQTGEIRMRAIYTGVIRAMIIVIIIATTKISTLSKQ
jgi:hypothetical protein